MVAAVVPRHLHRHDACTELWFSETSKQTKIVRTLSLVVCLLAGVMDGACRRVPFPSPRADSILLFLTTMASTRSLLVCVSSCVASPLFPPPINGVFTSPSGHPTSRITWPSPTLPSSIAKLPSPAHLLSLVHLNTRTPKSCLFLSSSNTVTRFFSSLPPSLPEPFRVVHKLSPPPPSPPSLALARSSRCYVPLCCLSSISIRLGLSRLP